MAPAQAVRVPALAETVTLQEVAAAEKTATLREVVVAAAGEEEETATLREGVAVVEEGATGIRREAGVPAAMVILPAETAGPIGVTGEFRVVARMTQAGAAAMTTTIRRPITWRLVRCRSRGP